MWEAGRVETFPGLFFLEFPVAPQVWQCTQQRLRACRLRRLQYFVAWQRLRGEPWETLGPVPITSRDRTTIYAGLTGQQYPSSSSRGLDHLLPLVWDQRSPTANPRPWPEPDISFVVEFVLVWRQHAVQFSTELRHIVKTLATALVPLEEALSVFRCASAKQVAAAKRPAFMAATSLLLRWPDLQQPVDLLKAITLWVNSQ